MSNPKNDGRKIVLLVLFALTVGCGAVQTPPNPRWIQSSKLPQLKTLSLPSGSASISTTRIWWCSIAPWSWNKPRTEASRLSAVRAQL